MVVATRQRKPFKSSQDSRAFVAYEAAGGQIDEANNVVRGVKVVGRKSAHGYEYSAKAVEEAKNLYEGARVYFGHKKERATRTGDYGDGFGVLKNYHVKEGEGYADLHYNPHHPRAAQFLYDVKNTPKDLGFSHHADIRVSSNRGRTVVESIDKVYSVDIVNVPATTKGVFESVGDSMNLKEMIEAAAPKSLTVLEDMMAGGTMAPDMPVDVAEGSDADAQIKAAFRSAVTAAFDDESLDSKATLAKIKDVLNAYDKLTGAGKKADAKPADAAPATESVDDLKTKLTKLERRDEVRTLATAEKVELSDLNLRVAVALESEADRTAFVKSLPKLGAKAPAPRPNNTTGGGTVLESADDAPSGPPKFKTAEERAAFLRS